MTDPETRRKGAHFLSDAPGVVARLVDAAAVLPGESVLDVGSGPGAVTRQLAALVGPQGHVTAVDNDPVWAKALKAEAAQSLPNVRVVEADALAVRLPDPLHAIVANPPFRILPGLVRRLLEHGFGRAVLVVPDEFARRLTAQPGGEDYGKLTVQVAARAKAQVLFPLRRRDFDPPPDVACHVLKLVPKPAGSATCDWGLLDKVLEAAWEGRRKTLRHSLAPLADGLGVPPATITAALAQTNAAGRAFAQLSPWEFVNLTQALGRELAPA